MSSKVIVIVGPTAVGKTKISIELAKQYGIEIISGDSIAIYRGLDIGSAKPTPEEMQQVPHHLIDICDPEEEYSVADFQREARSIITSKPLSIICGGTGLYIQAALMDYEFTPLKRNRDLEKTYENYTNEELYLHLKQLDPAIDESKLHPNNRKRVLRAIEVIEETGTSIHSYQRKNVPLFDFFIVYLNLDRSLLYDRIHQRVEQMFQEGLEEEAKGLYEKGLPLKGIGYQEFIPYFEGRSSLEEVKETIKKNSRHLAKRQETWFKNQMDTHFYNVNLEDIFKTIEEIKKDIDGWLNV